MDKILLNVDDVANALSIGRTQVFELLRSGEIPSLKVGRRRLVPTKALEGWLEARMATQTANAVTSRPSGANEHGLDREQEQVTKGPLVTLRDAV